MEKEVVRRIIYEELPDMMRQDKEVQQFILELSRQQFADKETTESRFDRAQKVAEDLEIEMFSYAGDVKLTDS